jgi:hypothetical protein
MTQFTLVDGCISEEYTASICRVEDRVQLYNQVARRLVTLTHEKR